MLMQKENHQLLKRPNDDDDDAYPSAKKIHVLEEARLLTNIALPTVIVQLCGLLLWTETASSIGRDLGEEDSAEDLAGFSLASLSANISIQSIFIGILSASDTLSPQAFGAGNYREVGLLAIRGYASTLLLLVPLVFFLYHSESILLFLGQDEVASNLAGSWVQIYLLAIPFTLLIQVIQRFLTSQGVVMPLVYVGVLCCLLIHPTNLHFFIIIKGFTGSAFAMACIQIIQVLLLLIYLWLKQPYVTDTWPGICAIGEALKIRPTMDYIALGTGGLLSLSEWWFWETLCFLAGKCGVLPLSVHTVAYQLVPVLFMLPLGISIGLTVRLGSILPIDVDRAKKIVIGCSLCCVLLAAITATIVYYSCRTIVSLFTTDEEIIQGCIQIWPEVSTFIFLDFLYATNSGILRALGLQWRLGVTVVICLWFITLPLVYYDAIIMNGCLEALWNKMCPAYAILNTILFGCFYFVDWNEISCNIRKREGLIEKEKNSIIKPPVSYTYDDSDTHYGTTKSSERHVDHIEIEEN